MLKRCLSVLLTLCLLLPALALGERDLSIFQEALDARRAIRMDIGFEPGSQPVFDSETQQLFEDALNTLGFSLFYQNVDEAFYTGLSLTFDKWTALTLSMLADEKEMTLFSNGFGGIAIYAELDRLYDVLNEVYFALFGVPLELLVEHVGILSQADAEDILSGVMSTFDPIEVAALIAYIRLGLKNEIAVESGNFSVI